jgi:hypothetical protein
MVVIAHIAGKSTPTFDCDATSMFFSTEGGTMEKSEEGLQEGDIMRR